MCDHATVRGSLAISKVRSNNDCAPSMSLFNVAARARMNIARAGSSVFIEHFLGDAMRCLRVTAPELFFCKIQHLASDDIGCSQQLRRSFGAEIYVGNTLLLRVQADLVEHIAERILEAGRSLLEFNQRIVEVSREDE